MKLYSLYNKKEFFINPGLERVKKAADYFGNPQKKFKSILISGTNGKGSTAAFLESIFRNHGYKTGLFTSPHLIKENERWQINRKQIKDETLEEYVEKIKPAIDKFNLTYFEASTLIAFLFFYEENVDIAILEVGLGGRWDATNIVEPEVSIITNVSIDHTHLLGNTIEKITFEKLGIARKDKPLVIGSNQSEILKQAKALGIREIYVFNKDFKVNIKNSLPLTFDYSFKGKNTEDLKLSMLGSFQALNASTALTAFTVYSGDFKESLVRKALYETKWTGRMQILVEKPLVVIDGAHNEDAIEKSFRELKSIFPDKRVVTIYSGMKDKDYRKIIQIVQNFSDTVIFTKIPVSRGLDRGDFKEFEGAFVESIEDAIKRAVEMSDEKSVLFITGSLYLVGEVLKIFKKN